ncbi:MAG: glycosyltransferase, partial [Nitrososphaeraceae archaeon]
MKILHISHDSLPDWRVEKSAITAIRHGHDVSFAGAKISDIYDGDTFSKKYEINWTSKARYGIPLYWRSVKKTFERAIRDARPDIIHAHNIFSAKMVSGLGIPFVYDDHEYWSKTSRLLEEIQEQNEMVRSSKLVNYFVNKFRRSKRKYVNRKLIKVWSKWERELVESYPTITVSEAIAEELRLIGNT